MMTEAEKKVAELRDKLNVFNTFSKNMIKVSEIPTEFLTEELKIRQEIEDGYWIKRSICLGFLGEIPESQCKHSSCGSNDNELVECKWPCYKILTDSELGNPENNPKYAAVSVLISDQTNKKEPRQTISCILLVDINKGEFLEDSWICNTADLSLSKNFHSKLDIYPGLIRDMETVMESISSTVMKDE